MFVVDTNVLLYAANRDAVEHQRCRELLEGWRRQATPWYVTWSVAYEFLRVITHAQALQRPFTAAAAWEFLDSVLAAPSVRVLIATGQHRQVLREILREMPHLTGNLFHDAHIAALMREHGVRTIVTRDADFYRFPFLEVVDPLAA